MPDDEVRHAKTSIKQIGFTFLNSTPASMQLFRYSARRTTEWNILHPCPKVLLCVTNICLFNMR